MAHVDVMKTCFCSYAPYPPYTAGAHSVNPNRFVRQLRDDSQRVFHNQQVTCLSFQTSPSHNVPPISRRSPPTRKTPVLTSASSRFDVKRAPYRPTRTSTSSHRVLYRICTRESIETSHVSSLVLMAHTAAMLLDPYWL